MIEKERDRQTDRERKREKRKERRKIETRAGDGLAILAPDGTFGYLDSDKRYAGCIPIILLSYRNVR